MSRKTLGNPTALAIATNPKISKYGLITIGAIAGALVIKRLTKKTVENIRQTTVANNFGEDTQKGYGSTFAIELYASMHPNATWLWDGTDEQAIFEVGRKMNLYKVKFAKVSEMYKKQFNRNLLDDLQEELSASDLAKFNSFLIGNTISGTHTQKRTKKLNFA